jgi:pimeloyl-ACP methyl ester carboxylesterase
MAFRSSLWHNGSGNYGAGVLFTCRNRLAEAVGMRLRLITLACALLPTPCLADEADSYGYPFADPLEATVIGTPEEFRPDLPEVVPTEIKDILVFQGRNVPEIYWYTSNLRYTLAKQPGTAPLAFIIPGTGANFDASKSLILQAALYQAGMHVVSLSSPLHPNFIVSASASQRPGLLAEDAEDLYRAMTLIRRQIEDEIDVSEWHLVGYSLGATQAAFVARLDAERRSFGFRKVLLINPPVNPYHSARILDALFEKHLPTIADFDALFHQLMQMLSEVYSPSGQLVLNDDLVYQLYRRRPPPDSTLEALIGAAFRLSSVDLVFASDVLTDSGLLVAPGQELSVTDSLTPYFKAASQLSFEDYALHILYPYYARAAPDLSFEQLVEINSLRAIEGYLRTASNVALMHNTDDILLAEGDIDYLRDVFGERAQIYRRGGHSGNMAYVDNVARMLAFLSDRGSS